WFCVQLILESLILRSDVITQYLGMVPGLVIEKFFLWQLFTYMFLHAMSPWHVLFNMISLWFFGSELEMRWGSRQFLGFYVFCGVGAAIIYVFGVTFYSLFK